MRLYFVRHGAADWPKWEKPDAARPLTKAGVKELHEVAKLLARLKVRPRLILTSPLPRAAQTADILGEHLKARCREERLLSPGFSASELSRLLRKYPEKHLMLVGHEPDFSETIGSLTGARLKLSKAGVALVELKLERGTLIWLFPPKLARR